MADPSLYQKNPQEVVKNSARADGLARKLASLYQRWEALEQLK